MANSRKNNTTLKHLENYYEGEGCKCEARSSSECGCHDVDWTPKEVYELRADLEFRRELYKVQTAQLDKMRNERDEALSQIVQAECRAERFCQERDEARDKAERYRLEANAMMMQRDEAREALMKIEDICVDCEDACDDIQKIRGIAAKALESTNYCILQKPPRRTLI